MTPAALTKLTPGAVYRVLIRQHDLRDNRTAAKTGRWPTLKTYRVRRVFRGIERRLGEIPCAVFSARLRKGSTPASEISVPHYDLIEATEG